jgi:hypothetical protein
MGCNRPRCSHRQLNRDPGRTVGHNVTGKKVSVLGLGGHPERLTMELGVRKAEAKFDLWYFVSHGPRVVAQGVGLLYKVFVFGSYVGDLLDST